jgi:hypothetical protein
LFVAAFVVAGFDALGTSSMARAGCGDYVHLGNGAPRHDLIESRSGSPTDTAPSQQSPHSRSCQGPSCRQIPIVPFEPVRLPVSQGPDQKACLVCDAALPLRVCGWARSETEPIRVERHGLSIERPPRNCSV